MLLEPGRYLIEVSSPGFETYNEWVELSSDPQTVAVSLATAPVPEPTPSAETAANGRPIELEATSSEPADAESQIAMVTRPEVVSTTAATKAKDLSGKRHQDQVSGGQVGPRLTGVTGGCYEMGSPAGERSRNADERQHRVCIDSFWMSYAEVSVADFKTFLGASGYRSAKSEVKGCADPRTVSVDEWAASGDINERPFNQRSGYRLSEQPSDHPVVCVTWRDAMAYAKWLSESTGHKYQLPTESQWEYAARAGSNSAYPWGATVGKNNANCEGCRSGWGRASIVPVGNYPPNSWGFVDLNGNVREWTCSGYGKSSDLAAGCAATGASGSIVVRGGSWKDGPKELRNANRSALAPGHKDNTLGFRVVRVP
jgi:formylglycine-generating enzyme required for sulfatase activity